MEAPISCLVDIRASDEYAQGHLKGSLSFPAKELIYRSGELPPRTKCVTLIFNGDDSGSLDTANDFFTRARWTIRDTIQINSLDPTTFEQGSQPPKQRFWEPSPFVMEMLIGPMRGHTGVAYDFGCGSGRDMAFLAGLGWCVTGLDNRAKLLYQCLEMHNRYGGTGCVSTVQAHLTTTSPFRPRSADLVLMVRFLHRPLLASMLDMVAVGGYFLCSHFVDGVQHSSVGTPKSPDAYLGHDELMSWTDKADGTFEIIHNVEDLIDDGRPVVNFLARRSS
eukprot:GILI01006524.1.p1 GENE.GILI01006524.1~~GILI01006524.1.p1  ORF type:complete len:278 (+),score=5.96 GILI01006524.1:664-1497(+)